MSELPKAIEITIDGKDYSLLKNCAAVLFRKHVEVSYIAINEGDDLVRGYSYPDLVQWMAGYAFVEDEDGELHRHTTLYHDQTFRTAYGWSPIVIEKEEPSERELEGYFEVQTKQLEADLEEFSRGDE